MGEGGSRARKRLHEQKKEQASQPHPCTSPLLPPLRPPCCPPPRAHTLTASSLGDSVGSPAREGACKSPSSPASAIGSSGSAGPASQPAAGNAAVNGMLNSSPHVPPATPSPARRRWAGGQQRPAGSRGSHPPQSSHRRVLGRVGARCSVRRGLFEPRRAPLDGRRAGAPTHAVPRPASSSSNRCGRWGVWAGVWRERGGGASQPPATAKRSRAASPRVSATAVPKSGLPAPVAPSSRHPCRSLQPRRAGPRHLVLLLYPRRWPRCRHRRSDAGKVREARVARGHEARALHRAQHLTAAVGGRV